MRGVIERRHSVEVFANRRGLVSIMQHLPEGEQSVEVHPEDVPQMIALLQNAALEAENFRQSADFNEQNECC